MSYDAFRELRENPKSEPIRKPARVEEPEKAAKLLNGEASKQTLIEIAWIKSS